MNIIRFLDHFTSDELSSQQEKGSILSRRQAFNQLGGLSKKLAMSAVPLGAAMFSSKKVMAQSMNSPVQALQLALTLEYLEDEFYRLALESGVVPAGTRAEKVYMQIARHEKAHVDFLIAGLGENVVDKPTFDFTVGGAFDPFNENGIGQETAYAQLLALAQAFEDTGVRAYKGQAANLMSAPDLLTAALQIHSVEARHASEIRRLRGLKGWIVQNNRGEGMPEATQGVYDGEEVTNQAGYDTTMEFGADAGTEAYDEPMSGETAVAIASLFIVS
ncbi:ferritin-like domain-containing protein [Catalinimonas niigatensis]|uniref:ferritin-like domain-containing protein n=1 Tax=Catalinimonas niigatensis TaxID=1397264 RepID=UPI00266594D1|nr:ferritin-like domain-containing protein [Catalinimonas niigatensis]WPP53433.1 ferritin-like domain-containing protein [Catalinimonas niigatensis]